MSTSSTDFSQFMSRIEFRLNRQEMNVFVIKKYMKHGQLLMVTACAVRRRLHERVEQINKTEIFGSSDVMVNQFICP